MFEAVLTLCAALAAGPCRDTLLPGFEAATRTGCEAALAAHPPDPTRFHDLQQRDGPVCRPAGPALSFEEVAPGLFVHTGRIEDLDSSNRGDTSNIVFVIGERSVAVIDSGSARWMGEAVWRAIRARTDKPLTHVVLTHMHPDHVLGAAALAETGAEVIGHDGLSRALADRAGNYLESFARLLGPAVFLGTVVPEVDRGIAEEAVLDLGGRALILRAWPSAHTGTDLSVFDPATGTLIAGDLVFDRHIPALDGSLTGWQRVLGTMAGQVVARLVPGHGGPVLEWPEGAAPMLRYLGVLEADTRAALRAGERLGDATGHIAAEEATRWQLSGSFNARNATVAYTELEWE